MGIVDDPWPEREEICSAIFRLVGTRFSNTHSQVLAYSLICALAQAIAVEVEGAAPTERKARLRHYQKVLDTTVESFLSSRPATTITRQ
jgi:hypothetical protein